MADYPKMIREVRANWLTIPEIAAEYDMPERRIRLYMEKGKIEAFWLDGRYMINPATLDAYLESQHKQVLTTG